jgi:polysaccharide pyruvyl transferase WcaK-like protein
MLYLHDSDLLFLKMARFHSAPLAIMMLSAAPVVSRHLLRMPSYVWTSLLRLVAREAVSYDVDIVAC